MKTQLTDFKILAAGTVIEVTPIDGGPTVQATVENVLSDRNVLTDRGDFSVSQIERGEIVITTGTRLDVLLTERIGDLAAVLEGLGMDRRDALTQIARSVHSLR